MKKPNSPSLFYKQDKDRQKPALQVLCSLHIADSKVRYPNVPDYARPAPKYSDSTANGLTKAIIAFIRLSGGQAERISSSGRLIDFRGSKGGKKWIKGSGTKGTADISATIFGRSVKIEVKIGRDRQSDFQKAYQKAVEAAGGIYIIAKDFQGFYDWYQLTFNSHE